MLPSEQEIAERLETLRRRRDAIEREIGELVLYRDLGRRLAAAGEAHGAAGPDGPSREAAETAEAASGPRAGLGAGSFPAHGTGRSGDPPAAHARPETETGPAVDRGAFDRRDDRSGPPASPERTPGSTSLTAGSGPGEIASGDAARQEIGPGRALVPAVAFDEDPVAARRYGRALIEAVLDSLRRAGRPMHAGEILEHVVARGFTVPGRDPVAALNTRLWKRSGAGGPLRRLGDAVYALAEGEA